MSEQEQWSVWLHRHPHRMNPTISVVRPDAVGNPCVVAIVNRREDAEAIVRDHAAAPAAVQAMRKIVKTADLFPDDPPMIQIAATARRWLDAAGQKGQ